MGGVTSVSDPVILKHYSASSETVRAWVALVGARPLQFMRQLISAWCVIIVAICLRSGRQRLDESGNISVAPVKICWAPGSRNRSIDWAPVARIDL